VDLKMNGSYYAQNQLNRAGESLKQELILLTEKSVAANGGV
jgi:hypothetical protein